jgi:uncharacterized protein YheU (UPF0270 family)
MPVPFVVLENQCFFRADPAQIGTLRAVVSELLATGKPHRQTHAARSSSSPEMTDDDEIPTATMVEIPYTELDPDTLRNVVDDLVTRDGTDYGAEERTREQKTSALMRQLERGEAKLVFDPKTETIGLMTADEFRRVISAAR